MNSKSPAANAERRVRWVTNVPGKHSFGLPLLQTILASGLTSLDFANALVAAMGFCYGHGNGEDYWQMAKTAVLGYIAAAGESREIGGLNALPGPGRDRAEFLVE